MSNAKFQTSVSRLRIVDGYQRQLRKITENPPDDMSDDGVTEWVAHVKRLRAIIMRMGYLPIETQGTMAVDDWAARLRRRNADKRRMRETENV